MPITDRYERAPVEQITVNRDRRQRRAIDPEGLVESIRMHGVIQPIIVTEHYVLVAGERRLTASKLAGLPDIPIRFSSELTPAELQMIELEENLKRLDLPWQDLVRSAGRIHEMLLREDPSWTMTETAKSVGLAVGTVSIYLRVNGQLHEEKINAAGTVREAYNILARRDQRAAGEALQDILDVTDSQMPVLDDDGVPLANGPSAGNGGSATDQGSRPLNGLTTASNPTRVTATPPVQISRSSPLYRYPPAEDSILHETFLQWAPRYSGKKFNLLHCDFPYGVNLFNGPQGRGAEPGKGYTDTKDVYVQLIECLCNNLDRLLSVSAHMMFWYSDKHRRLTEDLFMSLAPSLHIHPFPLVWVKSDNAGISSDAAREPRHVYETCMLLSRGGRNLVQIKADAYSSPTDKKLHPSTKPEPMLKHFMSMFVDENTRMFDPTCGSAASLRAAEELGSQFVLGMDIDEQCVGGARVALRQSRALRTASKGIS